MPEGTTLAIYDDRIQKAKQDMTEKFGRNEWEFTIHASSFSVGTKKKPYTTMWAWDIHEKMGDDGVSTFTKVTDDAFYADAKRSTDRGIPKASADSIRARNSIDWDDLRAMPGTKYKQKFNNGNGAPWREDVGTKNATTGSIAVARRGHELVVATGDKVLRIGFGLEAQVIVLDNQYWDLIRQNGTVAGNQKEKWKAQLMRSFVQPHELQNPWSRDGQGDRSLVIFASWRFCHDDGVTILLIDHARLLRLSLLRFLAGFSETFLDPSNPAYQILWDENHGPDFILEPHKHSAVLEDWREDIRALPKSKDSSATSRMNKPIALELCDNAKVFNGFGAHTSSDLAAMASIHPCTPLLDVCTDDKVWALFIQALERCRQRWTPENLAVYSRHRTCDNPLAFDYYADKKYINGMIYVAQKETALIDYEDWQRMAEQGFFDESHVIGTPYGKQITYHAREHQRQRKWVRNVRVYSVGDRYWYTPITAITPSHWGVLAVESAVDESDGSRIWKDLRACGLTTTLGPASFRDQKLNEYSIKKMGKAGRRKVVRTGKRGRPSKNRPTVKELEQRMKAGSVRRSRAKVGQAMEED